MQKLTYSSYIFVFLLTVGVMTNKMLRLHLVELRSKGELGALMYKMTSRYTPRNKSRSIDYSYLLGVLGCAIL